MSSDEPIIQSRVYGSVLNPSSKGKCFSCGFLSRINTADPTNAYREIEWPARMTGAMGDLNEGEIRDKYTEPYVQCLLQVVDVANAIERERRSAKDWTEAAQRVFWEERNCSEWFGYLPGVGPTRHLERYEMHRLEQDRRDFEVRLSAMSQQIQQDSKRASWFNFWAAIILGIVVIIISLMQLRLASRPTQIIIQQPSQQSESVKPEQTPTLPQ